MAQSGGVDRSHAPSRAPKLAFSALHAISVAVCFGLAASGILPDAPRAWLLAVAALLYFLRHQITLFVLIKRRVDYPEALGLSAMLAAIEIGFVAVGGGALRGGVAPLGWLDGLAIALVLAGSWLNSGSELQRWAWKRDPAHAGQCYTGGLFGYAMHINYFGDTLLFTGWALLTASLWPLVVPLFMAASFIFFHIPPLDRYLAGRYGAEFEAYAARTKKFVPWIY